MKTSSADSVDAIAVSEKARQQIGCEASNSRAKLHGPSFVEGFPQTVSGPNASANGVNVATVHWKL
jgi:hypothetical protein